LFASDVVGDFVFLLGVFVVPVADADLRYVIGLADIPLLSIVYAKSLVIMHLAGAVELLPLPLDLLGDLLSKLGVHGKLGVRVPDVPGPPPRGLSLFPLRRKPLGENALKLDL